MCSILILLPSSLASVYVRGETVQHFPCFLSDFSCPGAPRVEEDRIWGTSFFFFFFLNLSVQSDNRFGRVPFCSFCNHEKEPISQAACPSLSLVVWNLKKKLPDSKHFLADFTHRGSSEPLLSVNVRRSVGSGGKSVEARVSRSHFRERGISQYWPHYHKTGASYLHLSHQTVSCCLGGELLTQC